MGRKGLSVLDSTNPPPCALRITFRIRDSRPLVKWERPVKLLITILLISALLAKVKWSNLAGAFEKADLRGLPFVLVCSVAMLWLRTYKWYALLRQNLEDVSFKDAWISFLGGTSLGVLTPGRLGELGRIFFLRTANKVRAGELMVIDRLFDLAIILLFAAVGAAAVKQPAWALLTGPLALSIFYLILHPEHMRWLYNRVVALPLVRRLLPPVSVSERGIGRSMFLSQLAITTANFLLDLISFYLLLDAFEKVRWPPVFFAFPLILLSNLLPITLGGLGVREGASMLLLSLFGISNAAAIDASLLLYLLNTLLPGLFGALFFLRRT